MFCQINFRKVVAKIINKEPKWYLVIQGAIGSIFKHLTYNQYSIYKLPSQWFATKKRTLSAFWLQTDFYLIVACIKANLLPSVSLHPTNQPTLGSSIFSRIMVPPFSFTATVALSISLTSMVQS